jgi:hypothetical protein
MSNFFDKAWMPQNYNGTTQDRTSVFRCTFQCSTTAPHFLILVHSFQCWPIKTGPWSHVFVKHFGANIWLCWFLKTHLFNKNLSNLYLNTILCSLVSERGRGGCASITVDLFRQWQYCLKATFVTVKKVRQWQWLPYSDTRTVFLDLY